ncbi:MAG: hypothetical protein IKZ65_03175 [Lachnospiraceae bacterium]|nr:hypothetical protein [Lachnospiraceae bacterium]
MKTQKETKKEINTVSEDTKAKIVEGEIADDTVNDAAGGFVRIPRAPFQSDPPKRTFIP